LDCRRDVSQVQCTTEVSGSITVIKVRRDFANLDWGIHAPH
jgi:hypothetical protein